MLDLEKLKIKLEKALQNETEETLKTWLDSKKLNDYSEYLGIGTYVTISEGIKHGELKGEILRNKLVGKSQIPNKNSAYRIAA